MKKIVTLFLLFFCLFSTYAQDNIRNKLIAQGAWFLFSTRTEERFDDGRDLTQIDFFKKQDVSSIFFDRDDKLYSVFSNDGSDVWEDLWRMVDETHFVMLSPVDKSSQLMSILELTSKQLVFRNCADIEGGARCVTYTYFSSKDGWLSDHEINELNSVGIIDLDELAHAMKSEKNQTN